MAVSQQGDIWVCEDLQHKNARRIEYISKFVTLPELACIVSDYMIGPIVQPHDVVWVYQLNSKSKMSVKTIESIYEKVAGPNLLYFVFEESNGLTCQIWSFQERSDMEKFSDINGQVMVTELKIPATEIKLRVWINNATSMKFPFIGTYRGTYCGVEKLRTYTNRVFSFGVAWWNYKTDAVIDAYQNLLPRHPIHAELLLGSNEIRHSFGFGFRRFC